MPYARGILRLQHVTFFNWCEPPMGASLSVLQGLISPERRKVFPAARALLPGRAPCRVAVWVPGPAWPHPRAVRGPVGCAPCGGGPGCLPPEVLLVLVRACPEVLRVRQLCLALCVNTKLEMTSAMAWTVLRCQCCGLAAGPQHVQAAGDTTAAGCRRWGVPSVPEQFFQGLALPQHAHCGPQGAFSGLFGPSG